MPTENFSPNDELGNPQETTPITSQPQSQTVDEYYSNLATTAEANRDKIQELGEKSAALNEELSQQEKRLNTAEEAYKKSTGIFQGIASDVLQKKEELKTNLVRSQAERTDNKLKAEESTLRNEYYGQTGNTKDFLRATDPTRLREIAIANQLNESQGPSVRVSDMTAEQIQERKEFLEQQKALRESGIETKMPLPERESLEQKEARYDQDAVEAFSFSITRLLEQKNNRFKDDDYIAPEYRRKITSEKSDIEVFSKMVYDERKKGGAFGIRDLGVGSNTLRTELDQHLNSSWYKEQEKTLKWKMSEMWDQERIMRSRHTTHEEITAFQKKKTAVNEELETFFKPARERNAYIDRISSAEDEVVFKIAMWNMTNEICRDLGTEEITSEQFINMMERAQAMEQYPLNFHRWADKRYLDARKRAKERANSEKYPEQPWSGITEEVAGFVQMLSEDIDKDPLTLKKEDIPYIVAFYTNTVATRDIPRRENMLWNKIGLEYAIKHVLINDSTIDKEKSKNFETLKYLAKYRRRIDFQVE